MDDPSYSHHKGAGRKIVLTSSIVYLSFALLGLYLDSLKKTDLFKKDHFLSLPNDTEAFIFLLSLGLLSAGVILVFSHVFEGLSVSYQSLKTELIYILGPTPTPALLYLAAVSAIGEELLFRAGMQPHLGIFLTSVLFGLLHLGPGIRVSVWSLWAFLAGLLFSWTYDKTASLWPSIIGHSLVNVIGMLRLRRQYLKGLVIESNEIT